MKFLFAFQTLIFMLTVGAINGNNSNDECCGENMVYSLKLNDTRIVHGQKFDCSLKWLLDRYKLSDKHAVKEKIQVKKPGDAKFTFVTAAKNADYPSFRALISNIKDIFGCKQRVIFYDLESVTKNAQWVNELNAACALLEWRVFDYTQLNDDRVRHIKSDSWRIFILAHALTEYDTVVWLDTTVVFESNKLASFLSPIQNGTVSSVRMPSFSSHGMFMATHPDMFKFFPIYTTYEPKKTYAYTATFPHSDNTDPPQFETSFVVLHKTEQTRQLMKWALICAAEPNCMVPTGQNIVCNAATIAAKTCHRHSQSLLGILRYNMEYRQEIEDPSTFLPQINAANPHAKKVLQNAMQELFHLNIGQKFSGSEAEFIQKIKCCDEVDSSSSEEDE